MNSTAVEHGWWEDTPSFGEIIALCHSELSEALEEYRAGTPAEYKGKNGEKPEGIAAELADCIIRILDYYEHAGIDIGKAVAKKMNYNDTRPWRHGGKIL